MGLIKKTLEFLFGKSPPIFGKNGTIQHKFPKAKWEAWQNRYLSGAEYNWRNHTGMRAKAKGRRPI